MAGSGGSPPKKKGPNLLEVESMRVALGRPEQARYPTLRRSRTPPTILPCPGSPRITSDRAHPHRRVAGPHRTMRPPAPCLLCHRPPEVTAIREAKSWPASAHPVLPASVQALHGDSRGCTGWVIGPARERREAR
jgi:hypothetical protein